MGLFCSGKTDIGKVRKSNQDSIYINRKKHIYVVADGMGGHNGGDIASGMAVKEIPEYVLGHFADDPAELSKAAIVKANKIIKAKIVNNISCSRL